ncbi:RNA-directed DNA polymerase [Lutimonas halocynthiae]|uniref:RNA-directed DNA polymerase n=1 Tax=Lutimonas halocynthiae TaxID=1446477 RepID=UPI0025B4B794|nr:RNA-directed DNA polymerase [Lutimonas halocynthiae]MDN3642917.1 RNA-directed DNA polymerase [Lutimonas halocynthiae]
MKTYKSYYNQITKEELFEGLLGNGLFANKIPSVFTSEQFFDFVLKKDPGFPKKGSYDFIRYENMRNINVPRLLAIPNPIGYHNLIKTIVDNWDELTTFISEKTSNQLYKVSKVHIRKKKDSKSLFEMNYKTYEDEPNKDVDLIIGKRYKVHGDISNCFPSIYSHSIPWALLGKATAKRKSNDKLLWQNQLDFYVRNIKNQETNGLLIGPHSSNLISELILISIDHELVKMKYKFTRHIDDYVCYTKHKEEAEKFLVDLNHELKKYELSLNHKKSIIDELPHSFVSSWVRKLKNHRFKLYKNEEGKEFQSLKETEVFLDLAIDLMHSEADNSAILNYALNMLSKKPLNSHAVNYLVKRVHHLCYIYPYLIQIIDKLVFTPFKVMKSGKKAIAETMFDLGIEKQSYEACSYSLFFALKYNFKIDGFNMRYESFKSDDCVFMTLAYLYSKQQGKCLTWFYVRALSLQKKDFDKYWVYVYEVLKEINLKGPYKAMKKNKVSFIKPEYH